MNDKNNKYSLNPLITKNFSEPFKKDQSYPFITKLQTDEAFGF